MKTIKVIDLLNKIANGEEVPKKIKFRNDIYGYYERIDGNINYKEIIDGKYADDYLSDKYFIENILNEEVEIIEEKKIPKIIPEALFQEYTNGAKVYQLYKTVSEIIDYLKSKGDE